MASATLTPLLQDCIHPSQNHTSLPSNVNDEDMEQGPGHIARQISEYTVSLVDSSLCVLGLSS